MHSKEKHAKEVKQLQMQMKDFFSENKEQNHRTPLSLKYTAHDSYTTRTKGYKKGCRTLDCGSLNQIVEIDPVKQIVLVEPRVTMESLVNATLPYGLTAPVIPEFKNITVGGAILGMAAESASHHWGTFNDVCTAFEIIIGDGTLLRATPTENSDLFYGIAGSYGSLGLLVLAEIKLIPAKDIVHLCYHTYNHPKLAVEAIQKLSQSKDAPDFLDGILFAKDLAVVIEGKIKSKKTMSSQLPHFSQDAITAPMYYQHVKKIANQHKDFYEETMTLSDYFFRYDLGGFWTGAHLFNFSFSYRLLMEGIWKISQAPQEFNETEIQKFHEVPYPNALFRACLRPLMSAKRLCQMLHQAERWIQQRMMIQDFCIPESRANHFLEMILDDPAIFPIWLLPIRGTRQPQIFAPHILPNDTQESLFMNFGLYGIPAHSSTLMKITKKLEQDTQACRGRKTLYSRSYYTPQEFWSIYSHEAYASLRDKTFARDIWHDVTDKVLSE